MSLLRFLSVVGLVGLTLSSILPSRGAEGQLWAFGENQNGQLADSTTTNKTTPTQVVSGVMAMAAGGDATTGSHAFYLKSDGVLWGVGYNVSGQLGDGSTTTRLTPVQVMTSVSAVSTGIAHTLILKTDGTVWATGFNQYGQLGDGTTTNRSTPVQVATGVYAVSAGGNHSLLLKLDGTVWAMGYNSFGQIGNNTRPTNQLSPVQVATSALAIAAGGSHSLVLKQDGTLWVAGWNASGQLGTGPANSYLTTLTQLTTGVSAIAAGNQHSLFIKTDATLWAMGQNLFGQLGDGSMPTNQKTPVQISAGVSAVATGVSQSYFLKPDGSLWAMGLNNAGQLGDGTTTDRSTPVAITDEVLAVTGGPEAGYFLKAPGLSTQLDTWIPYASTPSNQFNCLIYADGRFVAGSSGTAPNGGMSMTSADGIFWTQSGSGALPNLDVMGITFGASRYVAVGANETGGGGGIVTSVDGLTWSAPVAAAQPLRAVAFGNSLFVAVGDSGLIRSSIDGTTWTTRTSGTVNTLRGLTYGGGLFIAVGDNGTVLTSSDATNWTARTAGSSGTANQLAAVTHGNGRFVAVGNGILTSTDGTTWTQTLSALSDGTRYYAVTYAIGQYVAAGVNSSAAGTVLHSADGLSWTAHNPSVGVPIRGIAHGSTRFVIAGDSGTEFSYTAPVGSAPVVTTNPVSQSVYAGNPVSFTAFASGAPTLTYQWKKDGVVLAGATSATYSLSTPDVGDAGSLTLSVSNAAGSATSQAATLTILKSSQTITFPALPTHYYGDAPFALSATASSGLPVTFALVSGPATLAGNVITITGVGTVTVRASQPGNISYYAATNVDRSFSVGKGVATVTWPAPAAVTYGTTLSVTQLNATASLPGTLTYSPSAGTLLNAGAHTLSVTFTPTDTVNFATVTTQQSLTINKAPASVGLSGLSITYDGGAHPATVTTNPADLTVDLTYDGSVNPPVNAGNYAVVGTVNSGNYTGSASGTLTIVPAAQTITFGALVDRYYGTPAFTLAATVSPSGLPVTYSVISGPATISGSTVTLTATGSVTIRASQGGNANYAAAPNVDRTFSVLSPQPTVTWAPPLGLTYGTALSSTQLNATANVPGTFVYSPVAGTVLTAGTHTLSTTFTPTDTVNYSSTTAQQVIVIARAAPVLSWAAPTAITYGTALDSTQLNATANNGLAGTFAYTPSAGTVLATGSHSLAVVFNPTDSGNYTDATAQQSLTVNRATAQVALSALIAVYDGTAKMPVATTVPSGLPISFTFNGSATAPSAIGSYAVTATVNHADYTGSASGTFTIAKADQTITFTTASVRTIEESPFGLTATASPSNLAVSFSIVSGPATISGNLVTLTGSGTVVIRASQAGNLSYNAAPDVDRTITVSKAVPVITWSAPSSIITGTALDATQLNATANVPGAFVYSPAAGTVLPLGLRALSVTFTPSDTARYTLATAQQSITVTPPPGLPEITAQPAARTVIIGTDVTLAVDAVSTLTMTYQWRKDGVDLPGATANTYFISRAQPADSGSYQVVVTSSAGSVTSDAAIVAVVPLASARPPTFDANGYFTNNPDVAATIGNAANRLDQAWDHYLNYGVNEGRHDGDFQVDAYLAQYADLSALFGNDRKGAALHWYLYGRYEGRRIPAGFDVPGYYARNQDVKAYFGPDQYGAWLHFRDFGLWEGRTYDTLFRVDEYLELNQDLKAAFGSDKEAALMHWLVYGHPIEDRMGRVPIGFNVDSYLARYPDLGAAFGAITPLAVRNVTVWQHYLDWGVVEGRSDGDFEAYAYLALYGDLAAVYGTNIRAAAMHWYVYGRREGRRIPGGFDVPGYYLRNPDVEIVNGNDLYGAWLHFRDVGIYEGRNYDDLFRVDEYLARYADIRAIFGTNLTGALLHWLYYGQYEGRSGRAPL